MTLFFVCGYRAAQRLLPPRGEEKEKRQAVGAGVSSNGAALAQRCRPGRTFSFGSMRASDIEARAVAKIVLVALFWVALAVLLAIAILHTRTTLRWVADRDLPGPGARSGRRPAASGSRSAGTRCRGCSRSSPSTSCFFAALVFLVLHVLPPIDQRHRGAGEEAADLRHRLRGLGRGEPAVPGAERTSTTSPRSSREQASSLPSKLGSGATDARARHGERARARARVRSPIMTLTFFMLLEGKGMFERGTGRLPSRTASGCAGPGSASPRSSARYVSVNLRAGLVAAGSSPGPSWRSSASTWRCRWRSCSSPSSICPADRAHDRRVRRCDRAGDRRQPYDALLWLVIFLAYQQLQDRVIQPVMYRGGALKVNPVVAIVAVLVGAEPGRRPGGAARDSDRRVARGDPGRAGPDQPRSRRSEARAEVAIWRRRAASRSRSRPTSSGPRFQKACRGAPEALLGALELSVVVEELRPDRVGLAQPEGADQPTSGRQQAEQRHPELLLRDVDRARSRPRRGRDADEGEDLVLDAVGRVDPAAEADQDQQRRSRRPRSRRRSSGAPASPSRRP